MKKIIEDDNEGLMSLMGERVTFFCCRYIYTGKLVGVNDDCVKLEDCGIVFETGSFGDKGWSDYQRLPHDCYVQKASVESYMILK